VADAQRLATVRSAELARQLRLPPQVQLMPAEEFALPIDYVDSSNDIETMIAMAMRGRPEVRQYAAMREAACWRVTEEKWRPWIPHLQVGASTGGFGGGPSTTFPGTAGRSDVDLLAVWELQNMGAGNVALQRQRRGQLHQRVLELEAVRDRIAAQVVAAAADVDSYRQQVEIARDAIVVAHRSYQLNNQRIRESEGLPIELLQSIAALAEAQTAHAQAAANYNQAQYRLMGAMGNLVGR
jgi:outer membrane protein TolC